MSLLGRLRGRSPKSPLYPLSPRTLDSRSTTSHNRNAPSRHADPLSTLAQPMIRGLPTEARIRGFRPEPPGIDYADTNEGTIMPRDPNDILAAELKKLAVKTTKKKTGAELVSWVAKKLPNDAFQVRFQTQADPESVLKAACAVLQEEGRIEDDVETSTDTANISGIVGSGFLGMNPALVTVHVMPADEYAADVIVAGVAKEGLIKQRGGEKAAKAIAARLTERLALNAD